jgi:hypothetical protein
MCKEPSSEMVTTMVRAGGAGAALGCGQEQINQRGDVDVGAHTPACQLHGHGFPLSSTLDTCARKKFPRGPARIGG